MKSMEFLEGLRRQYGNAHMRNGFYSLCKKDTSDAVRMLNDNSLQYPWLFILRPEITALALGSYLNSRNISALEITGRLISHNEPGTYSLRLENRPVLQWMLLSGYPELDLGDEYDRIMDFTAILLAREHQDRTSLQPLEEIIFSRHRKGLNTYDAEWAFFESRDPSCLVMVANRLRSTDPKDVELARRLLGFIPCFNAESADPAGQYRCVMQWINENKPFLRYTGESSLKGWNPRRFEVVPGFKYLQKPLSANGEPPPLSAGEQSKLNEFTGLDEEAQKLLSDYSHRLHANSKAQWDTWMQLPPAEQIEPARQLTQGGLRND